MSMDASLTQRIALVLQKGVSKLKNVEVGAKLSDLQELASVTETFSRGAKIVHDWGNQDATGLVMSGLLTDETPQEAIDVQSTPQDVVVSDPPNDLSQNNAS